MENWPLNLITSSFEFCGIPISVKQADIQTSVLSNLVSVRPLLQSLRLNDCLPV